MKPGRNGRAFALDALPPELPDAGKPLEPRGLTPFDIADETVPDGLEPDELKNISLQALQAVRHEIPAVNEAWHPHRDDDAGRFPGEPSGLERSFSKVDGKLRTENLLEETLEHCRHGAEPQRINDNQMAGLFNGGLRFLDGRGRRFGLPFAA